MSRTASKDFSIKLFTGEQARPYWREIAALRLTLFREYPYLYEGTEEGEKEYLNTYFNSKNCLILLVFDKDKVVGFSNSIPLNDEPEKFKQTFIAKGLDTAKFLYIGEVMLMPQYRGNGLLRKFFEMHEEKAKKQGFENIFFISSNRPKNHPQRPKDYRELGPIWEYFGYYINEKLAMKLSWKQVDTQREEENILGVWEKRIL